MDELEKKGLEKLIDKAFEFVDVIIKPPLQEVGGIFTDQVKFWRYKNQINILLKAKEYHDKKGISPKTIPVKTLVHLIEESSYEEEEKLKEKWSALLANATDPGNNFTLHNMFIDILKQLSPLETFVLEYMWADGKLSDGRNYRKTFETRILSHINLINEIKGYDKLEFDYDIEKIVLDNLLRLNLIEFETPKISDRNRRYGLSDKPEYVIEEKKKIRLTELGLKFIEECTFK